MSVHYGDLLDLFVQRGDGGYLACDGLVTDICFVVPGNEESPPPNFRRCVFEIVAKRQYYSIDEYLKFLDGKGQGISCSTTNNVAHAPPSFPVSSSSSPRATTTPAFDPDAAAAAAAASSGTISSSASVSASSVAHLRRLENAFDAEVALNRRTSNRKAGTNLLFGDTIQLRHIKSGRFLTILPSLAARTDNT